MSVIPVHTAAKGVGGEDTKRLQFVDNVTKTG
jgi:hypothetical protein